MRNSYAVEAMLYNKAMMTEVQLRKYEEKRAEQERVMADLRSEVRLGKNQENDYIV